VDNQNLGEMLREVARTHSQLQTEQVACCGTSATQCTILTELGRSGQMTLADLSRRLGLDKGWLSRSVEALVQEGLIIKTPGEVDRRTIWLNLSEEGQNRYQVLNQSLNNLSERVLEHVQTQDKILVEKALLVLLEALRAERNKRVSLCSAEKELPV
jgi:DNA-binding MarR family transcriptional regulator